MSIAETAIRRILDQYGQPQNDTGSDFLNAVGRLPPDRHDVAGAIFIAEAAFADAGEEDPMRPTLERLLEFKRADKRYDGHDMTGILSICDEGLRADVPENSRPRP